MNKMLSHLSMAALAMRSDLTPEERKILNQFLRGSNNLAD